MDVIAYIVNLGSYIFVPMLMCVIGLLFGLKIPKAIKIYLVSMIRESIQIAIASITKPKKIFTFCIQAPAFKKPRPKPMKSKGIPMPKLMIKRALAPKSASPVLAM